MNSQPDHLTVLRAYPEDCRARGIESLGSAGGFSGAQFWRIACRRGTLCLRRWPREYPSEDRLEFIQAVLWHATREGYELVPLPLETRSRCGYVPHGGFFWELSPWIPGKADYMDDPSPVKLLGAMIALARFHRATATFPLPNLPSSSSPGIRDRREKIRRLLSGDLDRLRHAIRPGIFTEMDDRAIRVLTLARAVASDVSAMLDKAVDLRIGIQPCICDIWHEHILFEGQRVSGLVDFGSMRPESVAADIARLLGSMAEDDPGQWHAGLDAYQSVRPLTDHELLLVPAFDRSACFMAGLNWIDWIYRQHRVFENRQVILNRLDGILARLGFMSTA